MSSKRHKEQMEARRSVSRGNAGEVPVADFQDVILNGGSTLKDSDVKSVDGSGTST